MKLTELDNGNLYPLYIKDDIQTIVAWNLGLKDERRVIQVERVILKEGVTKECKICNKYTFFNDPKCMIKRHAIRVTGRTRGFKHFSAYYHPKCYRARINVLKSLLSCLEKPHEHFEKFEKPRMEAIFHE